MRKLYNTVYKQPELLRSNSATFSASNSQSINRSIFEEDFDDDDSEQNMDEIDRYISEKSANRDIDILSWWKVSIVYSL
jgi:hypothetical protein